MRTLLLKNHSTFLCAILLGNTLAGCNSVTPKTQSVLQNSSSSIKESAAVEDDLFAKKQECQKYLSNVQERLDKRDEGLSSYSSPQKWVTTDSFLDKVFYSRKANSCLYKWTTYKITQAGRDQTRSGDAFYLDDALTGQNIVIGLATWGQPDFHDMELKFEEEVKPYEE